MKTLTFAFGLCIATVGAAAVVAPSSLVWIAQQFVTPGAFYVVAAARIGFGLALMSVSADSRAPDVLRLLGYVVLLAGIATALTGLLGVGLARSIIDDWLQLGSGVVRLTGVVIAALGGFVAYACAPARHI